MPFIAGLSKKFALALGTAGVGASLFFFLFHDGDDDPPFSGQYAASIDANPKKGPSKAEPALSRHTSHPSPKAEAPPPDPQRLAREVFHNEIRAQTQDQSLWCYHETKQDRGQRKLFAVCQTKDGEVDRLVAVNSTKLDASQQQAEDKRVQSIVQNRSHLRREQKKRAEDGKQTRDLMKMFPEAFRFENAGTRGDLVTLKFFPEPNFHPSSRAERVFSHMEGTLLVDSQQKRLLEIDGRLTSEVKFGGGWLGHLEKGGVFHVKQQEFGSGHWEMTLLRVQMRGKALFFKTINVQEDQTFTDFHQEPDGINLQQAFEAVRQPSRTEEAKQKSGDEARK